MSNLHLQFADGTEGYIQANLREMALDDVSLTKGDPEDSFIHSFFITSLHITPINEYWIGEIEFKNTTGDTIETFTLLYEFYDEQGNRVFEYPNTLEGYLQEVFTDTFDLKWVLSNNETTDVTVQFTVPACADTLRVAAQEFTTQNSDVVHLWEDQLVWYGSDDSRSSIPDDTIWYKTPSVEELPSGRNIVAGFTCVPLYEKDAQYYQYKNGGAWVVSVDIESSAGMLGLLAEDVIIGVDENTVTADNLAMAWANNRLAAGDAIFITVERNGSIYEGVLSLNPIEIFPLTRKQ